MSRTITYHVTDAEILEFSERQMKLVKAEAKLKKLKKAKSEHEAFMRSPKRQDTYRRSRCSCYESAGSKDEVKLGKLRGAVMYAQVEVYELEKVLIPDAVVDDLRAVLLAYTEAVPGDIE